MTLEFPPKSKSNVCARGQNRSPTRKCNAEPSRFGGRFGRTAFHERAYPDASRRLHATTQILPALLGRYLLVKHHYAFVDQVGRPDRESIVLNPTRTSLDRRRSNCQAGSLRSLIGLEYLTNNQS